MTVDNLRLRARLQQHTDQCVVVVLDGPVESGRAVCFRRADIRLLRQKRSHRREVAGLRGIDEGDRSRGDGHRDGAGERRCTSDHDHGKTPPAREWRATGTDGAAKHRRVRSRAIRPVLSPSVSARTPALSSSVSSRFVIGACTADDEVPIAVDAEAPSADHEERQVDVCVRVRIAQAGAVEEQRVIEQRAVAVGRRLQLVEEPGEQLRLIRVRPSRTSRSARADPGDATGRDDLR